MKILDRIFGGAMQAVREHSESELSARLSEITTAINAGEGDVAAHLEERERLKLKLEAARIVAEKRAGDEYRATNERKSTEYRARLKPCAEEIADLVPRLIWRLEELGRLEVESYGVPNPGFEENTGLPFNFARTLTNAIRDAADVNWHWDFLNDENARNPLPTQRRIGLVVPRFKETDGHGRFLGSNRVG